MKPKSRAARVEGMVGLSPSSSVRFCPAFVPTKEEEARRPVADEQTNFSNRTPTERYYTEQVQISSNKGADNELLRADANEKLGRGWRLVGMAKDPSGDSVELVWDTAETS
jgi:hypothetical protein